MRWRIPLILLGALAVIAILAAGAQAQTDPPPSGDWYIFDYTTFSGGKVDVPGNVYIRSGGTLALYDVDLLLHSGMAELRVEEGGTLITDGGMITTTSGYNCRININSPSVLNGTVIDKCYGIYVKAWEVSISNCTLNERGIGVQSPTYGNPAMPIDIMYNKMYNTLSNSIGVSITDENSAFKVNIVGNELRFPGGSGVNVSLARCLAADLRVEDNIVSNAGGIGIYLNLGVDSLGLEMDGNDVRDCDDSCVYLELMVDNLFFDGIDGLTAISSDRYNLHLVNWKSSIPPIGLTGLELRDAGLAGLHLRGARGVTIRDSTVIQTGGVPDFKVDDATLDIFNVNETVGRPWVAIAGGEIHSWRTLDLSFTFQNGMVVSDRTVELRDPSDGFVARHDVGAEGTWTGIKLWDQRLIYPNGADMRSFVTPYLLGTTTDLAGAPIDLDADKSVDVVFIDDVAPFLLATSPADGTYQNTSSLLVAGRVTDEHSGAALVQVSIDANPEWDLKLWLDAAGTFNWSLTLEDLADGTHTIFARAYDRANLADGVYATLMVATVTIDTEATPVALVQPPLPPEGDYLTNSSELVVSGTMEEEVRSLTVIGVPIPVVSGTFEAILELVEGRNVIDIVTTDLAGNTATLSFVVVLDTVAPDIVITAPSEGQYINDNTITVKGTVSEPTMLSTVTVDGVPVPVSDGSFERILTGQADGDRTVVVTAMDLAGNAATQHVSVVLDSTPPALIIRQPTDGLLTNHLTVTVSGTTESGATVTVNGLPVELWDGAFTTTLDLDQEGENLITVIAVDVAGNRAPAVVAVMRDTVAPILVIDGLENGTITARSKVFHLMGYAEEGVSIVYTIDGVDVPGELLAGGAFQLPLEVPRAGMELTVTVKDPAGNPAAESVLVVRPREQPAPEDPLIDDPVTVGAVVATTVVILGAAATIEVSKYSLILLILPLYARLKGDAVLDNKTRLAIHGLIIENPGMHYNEIIREFNLTNGVAAYHLDVLEREGFVRSVRDGTMRRFYSSSTKVPDGFKATPDEMRTRIIDLIDHYPGLPQKAIVDELGIGRTVAGYHLKALVDDGYLSTKRRGRFTLYFRTKKRWYENGQGPSTFMNS